MTSSSRAMARNSSDVSMRNLKQEVDPMEQNSKLLAALWKETGPRFSTAVQSLCGELLRQADIPVDALMDHMHDLEHDLETGIRALPVDSGTRPYADLSMSFLQWLQATYVSSTLRGAPSREELTHAWDGYREIQANVIYNLARKTAYAPPSHIVML